MAELFAAPTLAKITVAGQEVVTFDLQTAINKARPGDTIRLTAGVYKHPVHISRGGNPDSPITLAGPSDGSEAIFDGERTFQDGLYEEGWATDSHWAFVKLTGVANYRFEHIKFQNCWPAVFYVRGASDISFSDLSGTGARHVIFARNSTFRRTKNLLLERLRWVQDPDHDMWKGRIKWKEVKQRNGFENKSWFNGGLFESYDIYGGVTIRDCEVSHAFNAIRMQVPPKRVRVTKGKPTVSRNRDVRIYRNKFSYIRDNAIEPEGGLHGWLVAENHFFQVHAALSCDAVAIRNGAFICNRFLNISRPEDASNTGGKIIKFLDPSDAAESPACFGFVTAFNSIRTRTRYVSDAKLKPWTDVNNAVERFAANGRDDLQMFSNVNWHPEASTDSLATTDTQYPTAYAHDGAQVGDWDAIKSVFEFEDPEQDLSESLGGWNGTLPVADTAKSLATLPVNLLGPEGLRISVPASTAPGYRPLRSLGANSWIVKKWLP